MPILSSLGALTCIKLSTGNDWRYWQLLLQSVGANNISNISIIFNSVFDSTNEYIYSTGATQNASGATYNPIILRIKNTANIFTQPNLDWISRETSANIVGNITTLSTAFSTQQGVIALINNNSNLIVSMSQPWKYGPAYPSLTAQYNFDINSSANNINFTKVYSPRPLANGSGGGAGPLRVPSDIIIDSSNNYFTIGVLNQQIGNSPSGNSKICLTKFDGTTGNVITTVTYGNTTNVSVSGTIDSNLHFINAGSNIVFTVNNPGPIIASVTSDLTTINWQKEFSNCYLYSSTSDGTNTYITTLKDPFTSIITKVDSTGNLIWAKDFGNSFANTNNPSLLSISINESNTQQLICSGLVGSSPLNSILLNLDTSTGNINWQRKLVYSGTGPWANAELNANSIQTNNNQVMLSGYLQIANGYVATVLTLPIDGSIPGDGITQLNANLSLTISNSNATSSNGNITLSNVSYNLITPQVSTFANANITSNSNSLTSNTFINLA
jgi:hypothetical protein